MRQSCANSDRRYSRETSGLQFGDDLAGDLLVEAAFAHSRGTDGQRPLQPTAAWLISTITGRPESLSLGLQKPVTATAAFLLLSATRAHRTQALARPGKPPWSDHDRSCWQAWATRRSPMEVNTD
jgi:hypothetical protein